LPELVIAKESKLKSGCIGNFGLNETISAMFGNSGNFGNSTNGNHRKISRGLTRDL
jgi:hypothetical protein